MSSCQVKIVIATMSHNQKICSGPLKNGHLAALTWLITDTKLEQQGNAPC